MKHLIVFLSFILALSQGISTNPADVCEKIETAFKNFTEPGETVRILF